MHITFNEAETNKFDRHTRKFNSTSGMASDRPVIPKRGLESRIRAPADSPEEVPRCDGRGSGLRLDAGNLRAASAAAAVAAGGTSFTAGKFTSINQPATGRVNTSPKKLEESATVMNVSLMARQMPAGPTVAPVAERLKGQGGRPGQVYNAVTKRWQYVEEPDSDNY